MKEGTNKGEISWHVFFLWRQRNDNNKVFKERLKIKEDIGDVSWNYLLGIVIVIHILLITLALSTRKNRLFKILPNCLYQLVLFKQLLQTKDK